MTSTRFGFTIRTGGTNGISENVQTRWIYADTKEGAIEECAKWMASINDHKMQEQLMRHYSWYSFTPILLVVSMDIYEEITVVLYNKVATLLRETPL